MFCVAQQDCVIYTLSGRKLDWTEKASCSSYDGPARWGSRVGPIHSHRSDKLSSQSTPHLNPSRALIGFLCWFYIYTLRRGPSQGASTGRAPTRSAPPAPAKKPQLIPSLLLSIRSIYRRLEFCLPLKFQAYSVLLPTPPCSSVFHS